MSSLSDKLRKIADDLDRTPVGGIAIVISGKYFVQLAHAEGISGTDAENAGMLIKSLEAGHPPLECWDVWRQLMGWDEPPANGEGQI